MDRRTTRIPPTTTALNWDSGLNLPSSTDDSPRISSSINRYSVIFANQSVVCFCLLKTDQWHVSPTFPNKVPSLLVGVKILQAKLSADSARGLLILTVTWTDSLQSKIYDGTSNDLVIPTRPKKVFYYEESLSWKYPSQPRRIPPISQPIWLEKTETKGSILCCKGACVFRFETLWWLEVTVILSWAVPLQKLDNPRCERKISPKMTVRTGSPKGKLWYVVDG